jgi:cytochrome c556
MKVRLVALLTASLIAAPASFAKDDGPHDKAIKARQALMQLYSFNLGILSGMAKGKVDYNAEAASAAANNLLASVSMDQSAMWPPGSHNGDEANRKNRALPAIWDTYPKIVDAGKSMNEAATELQAVAGNGVDALKSAMGAAGKSCKGCHDDFRAKKK